MAALNVDGSGNLMVNVQVGGGASSGSTTAYQGSAPWSDNLVAVGGSSISLGQTTMAKSFPVAIASDQGTITVFNGTLDSGNSSTAILGSSGGIFTGAALNVFNQTSTNVYVYSDQSSATNGVSLQFSSDGTNWYETDAYTYTAGGNALVITTPTRAEYFRLIYTNGTVAQTVFQLQTIHKFSPAFGNITEVIDTFGTQAHVQLTKALLNGWQGSSIVALVLGSSGQLGVAGSGGLFPISGSATVYQGSSQWVVTGSGGLFPVVNSGGVVGIVGSTSSGALSVVGSGGVFPVTGSGGIIGIIGSTSSGALSVVGSGGLFPITGSGGVIGIVGSTASGALSVTGSGGLMNVNMVPVTGSGHLTNMLISLASTNGSCVKSSPSSLYGWAITNTNAALRYVKLYSKGTTISVGTDTPQITLGIPGNTAGAGMLAAEYVAGITFGSGLGYAITANVPMTDSTAIGSGDIVMNLFYN